MADIRFIDPTGVTDHPVDELASLLGRVDGVVWVDVPTWDVTAETSLKEVFGFHPMAIRDFAQRNQAPKRTSTPNHVFVVLHAPESGAAGHVHYVELDQFIGPRYLVSVHGPLNPAVANHRSQRCPAQPEHRPVKRRTPGRVVLRAGLRAARAAAELHRPAHWRRVKTRTTRHRRASQRS